MKLRGGKTDSEVTVYQVRERKIDQESLPDLSQTVRKKANFQEGRFYFESLVRWQNPHKLIVKVIGNTVDSIDPDGEYDYEYDLTVDVVSRQITHISEIKKALPPPSR